MTSDRTVVYRDLHSLEELRRVVELEKAVWRYTDAEDVVPVPILAINVKRGGILIGAFDGENRMVGFVYSLPGLKDGQVMQWSHMLGVLDDYRNAGLGRTLKLLQRERALGMGVQVIEWTFDPMQAMNAHLNLAKLGAVIEEYEENIYGESSSALHRGTPTDRFVAVWTLESARVVERIATASPADAWPADVQPMEALPSANATREAKGWLTCASIDLEVEAPRVRVEIPTGFGDMQVAAPDVARDWRVASRRIFTSYLPRGYRILEFTLDRPHARGWYVLDRAGSV